MIVIGPISLSTGKPNTSPLSVVLFSITLGDETFLRVAHLITKS